MLDIGSDAPQAPLVAVIDHGHANLFSLENALITCGARVQIVDDPASPLLDSWVPIVLPGVGAFGEVMRGLGEKGFDRRLRELSAAGHPILGICLGMQLLMDESAEFGRNRGLGLIAGTIEPIAAAPTFDGRAKIPHVGWQRLQVTAPDELTEGAGEDYMYFVHSYRAVPAEPAVIRAGVVYAGVEIPAVIRAGNVMGCQFHPEKSGPRGLRILENFLTMTAAMKRSA